jgi:two-component system sensor histidine kinase HydH
VNVSAGNIVGEEGQYIGFMFILQDLTELRRLELNVRQREKLAAIGNLAAGIAHEIRNPLSSIKGYVTYFGSLFEEGSENRKAAEIMAGEVDRVNRVISELLEFARPSDLKLRKTDLLELIDHSLRIVSHEAEFARVHLTKAFKGTLPELIIDPDRITQVLLNLLINAIQAMPEGGELILTAELEENQLLLHITDTGEGIAPENLAGIFNPYFTTKRNGTGLGLAIVHKIVEDHGGTVRIRSKPEMGTTVTIALPVIKEARP